MSGPNVSQQERTGSITSDDVVSEAGRKIMASLLTTLFAHEPNLAARADVPSVHESRKGMRRLRTALSLFAPFYEPGELAAYRKRFRKAMRRLARSRDIAVFLIKLEQYLERHMPEQEPDSAQRGALHSLQSYWFKQQSVADEKVLRFMAGGEYHSLLSDFEQFTRAGELPIRDEARSTSIGDVAPAMVHERLAAVLSCGDSIETVPLKRLHALRIQSKELRYTLEFFRSIMAPLTGELIADLKQLLTHLGDLNDARVHLKMLNQTPQEEAGEGVLIYRPVKKREVERLIAELPPVWGKITGSEWRGRLDAALSTL